MNSRQATAAEKAAVRIQLGSADNDIPQCPHCEQRFDLTGHCGGDEPRCGEQFLPDDYDVRRGVTHQ
jgi:hypothetical protein